MCDNFKTELEALNFLKGIVTNYDTSTSLNVFVFSREAIKNSPYRNVTLVVQTRENNEIMLNEIEKQTIDMKYFNFVKSEVSLEDKNMIVDYMFFEARIFIDLQGA